MFQYMLFFSEERNRLTTAYSNLFGVDDEDLEEEEEAVEGTGEDAKGSGDTDVDVTSFSYKWGWVHSIDKVSETMRISWDDAFKLNIIEFLNVLCYIKDKNTEERKQLDEYKQKNKLK